MSDGISDMYHEMERESSISNFIENILIYLQNPTAKKKKELIEQNKYLSFRPKGFWNVPPSYFKDENSYFEALIKNDEIAWASLFYQL